MKNYYRLSIGTLMMFFSMTCLYSQALFIDAENGTDGINGTYGDFTVSSDLSVAVGSGACPMGGDIWNMDTNTKKIIIRNNGIRDVEKIELSGILLNATGSAVVFGRWYVEPDGSGSTAFETKAFTTTSGTCDTYVYTPKIGTEYPKYFEFNCPTTVSGKNMPGIQSIAVYLKDTQTSLIDIEKDRSKSYVFNNRLFFTESVSHVWIYGISGALVKTDSDVTCISLETIPTGIYIVKITDDAGRTMITKIMK